MAQSVRHELGDDQDDRAGLLPADGRLPEAFEERPGGLARPGDGGQRAKGCALGAHRGHRALPVLLSCLALSARSLCPRPQPFNPGNSRLPRGRAHENLCRSE
ncbi:hypothetical protein GCM10010425_38570 [Streptomyces spororaveus]|uniref:Uncharacterized protein n=1 Tax=Streptomyces spororaveus TaxID=284039 RepID=A0ABQ3TQ03_9ACTN|nr:hypothetical protein Sspor_79480 [Streptomyces spororaveus]